jgi:alanine racemase
MVDTGMNRLGLDLADVESGLLEGLTIETLMSHLACADEDSPMNERQRAAFAALADRTAARRMSLANSAGIALGSGYHFDLTRPGLALYGGVPHPLLSGKISQVVFPEAQVIQVRRVRAGETVGYGATWTAQVDSTVAILNIGYADGYFRGFSNAGSATCADQALPVVGRVSMDLTAIDVSTAPTVHAGDWLTLTYDLRRATEVSGMSQYELLTSLHNRFAKNWKCGE